MNDSKEWYVARGSESIGPMTVGELRNGFQSGQYTGETLVFKQGMSGWTKASQVPELSGLVSAGGPGATAPPPPPTSGKRAHEVDYKIVGEEMQFVEIELDPGEGAIAEAGGMMYMTAGIEMNTIFGDGSGKGGSGFMDHLLGAGKRVLTGESLFMTEFVNQGQGKQHVAFASPYPGKIIPVDLSKMGRLIAQKDAFLCAAKGVAIGIAFQKKIGVALFGREGFIMQSLEGDGLAFLHAGGTIIERELEPAETLRVDTGCLVALEPSINYDIQFVGGVKSAVFGGEGFFFATLTGPGTVWLQSLPFSRLAGRVWEAAPQTGGGGKGEGSVLDAIGGIGNMFQR